GSSRCENPLCLFPRQSRRPEAAQERVNRAIGGCLRPHYFDSFLEFAPHPLDFAEIDPLSEVAVLTDCDLAYVKREHQLILGDRDRGVRLERMPDTKFIEGIRVVSRYIGDYDIRVQKLSVHWDVNVAGMLDLVCPNALVTRRLGGRLNDIPVR